MVELKNWHIERKAVSVEDVFYAFGTVYGHKSPRCPDGTHIHTTRIMSIEDKGDFLEVCTRNTVYTLQKQEISSNFGAEGGYFLWDFRKCFTGFLGEKAEELLTELAEIAAEKLRKLIEQAPPLENGMFYLMLSAGAGFYYDDAFYKDKNGKIKKEEMQVHVGMFQDSVLLFGCGVRYFPYKQNGIEFYYSMDEMFSEIVEDSDERVFGYIHNSGSVPLTVKMVWGKTVEIKPNETIPYCRAELEKYPDAKLASQADLYSPEEDFTAPNTPFLQ